MIESSERNLSRVLTRLFFDWTLFNYAAINIGIYNFTLTTILLIRITIWLFRIFRFLFSLQMKTPKITQKWLNRNRDMSLQTFIPVESAIRRQRWLTSWSALRCIQSRRPKMILSSDNDTSEQRSDWNVLINFYFVSVVCASPLLITI